MWAASGGVTLSASAAGIVTQQNISSSTQITYSSSRTGAVISFSVLKNPAHGSSVVTSGGYVSYTPVKNYFGSDSFTIQLADDAGATIALSIDVFVRGNMIPTSLPERVRFDASIVAACQTTIKLKNPAFVQAYFLDEGAGYHNQVGWYNTADNVRHTIWNDASSVRDLLGLTDGTLHTGDRVDLGLFSGGETLGFFLHNISGGTATFTSDRKTNSDGLNHVLILAIPNTDFLMVSFEDMAGSGSDYDYNDVMMLVRVGPENVQNWIDTSTQPVQYSVAQKYTSVVTNLANLDSDNDGVPDSQDQYPNDPTKAFLSYVPSANYTIVSYEDLFPGTGDYDFNDAVIAYRVAYITNATNKIVKIQGEATLLAHGAASSHDWHLRFMGRNLAGTGTVTQVPGAQSTNQKATRTVSSTASVLPLFQEIDLPVILNTGGSLPWHLGNTVPGWSKGTGDTATFTITLDTPLDPTDLQGAPFDPYLINLDDGLDIHLPNQPLRIGSINPDGARTFINKDGMPWALIVPTAWQWPVEKTDIRNSYPLFTDWAASAGASHSDWYLFPSLANVVQTIQPTDKFIWAGNATPAVNSRSRSTLAVAPGFNFATIFTRNINLVANETVTVSLIPFEGNPDDALNSSVCTFRSMGSEVRNVQVPSVWAHCTAVVTPESGRPWTVPVDWRNGPIDISSNAASKFKLASKSCKVTMAAGSNTASIIFTGSVDPDVVNVNELASGTLYLDGVPVTFGAGSSPLKITKPTRTSKIPWNTFTLTAKRVNVDRWVSDGTAQKIQQRLPVTVSLTCVIGDTVLYGQAFVNSK